MLFPMLPGPLLKWWRDQIAEPSLRPVCLDWERIGHGNPARFRAILHGFRQDVRAKLAGQTGWNGFIKEHPDVPAVAGARSLQDGRRAHAATRLQEHVRVLVPACLV